MRPASLVIVSSERPDLLEAFRRRHAGDPDTEVLLDRRAGERRRRIAAVPVDRRRHERRSRPGLDAEILSRGWALVTGATGSSGRDKRADPDPPPRRHRCSACGGLSVQREVRRGWERWVSLRWRPYCCLDCGVRFYDRPLRGAGESRGAWWRAAMVVSSLSFVAGGSVMLWDAAAPLWTFGLNLLVWGLLGLIISAVGDWLRRSRR